jgi:hypothetical protein|nr:MAG TPA: hypothetical protein [Caudoviricetes sp.]
MYIEYNELLKQFKRAEKNYNEALEKKSKLILSVMPGAVKPKEVMITTNTSPDTNLINYTSEIDEVDKLINQSRNTRDMLNYELKKKLIKMKEEGDVYDKIYIYRWIEHRSVYKFYRLVGYSRPQVYRFISEMKENLYKNN